MSRKVVDFITAVTLIIITAFVGYVFAEMKDLQTKTSANASEIKVLKEQLKTLQTTTTETNRLLEKLNDKFDVYTDETQKNITHFYRRYGAALDKALEKDK